MTRSTSPVVLGDGSEQLSDILRAARQTGRKYGDAIDFDDHAQNIAVAALEAQRNQAGDNGLTAAPRIVDSRGVLHAIGAARAAQMYSGGHNNSYENSVAQQEFKRRLEAEEARLGRELDPGAQQHLADRISEEMPPGRRPTPGYHRRGRFVSLDAIPSGGNNSDPSRAIQVAAHSDFEIPDDPDFVNFLDKAHLVLGTKGRKAVRSMGWKLMAHEHGAPDPVAGANSEQRAKAHRETIAGGRGAHSIAIAVEDGEATPAQEAALFAPFGPIGTKEKAAVVSALTANPGLANEMWNIALGESLTRRSADRNR